MNPLSGILAGRPLCMVDVGASYFLPDTWNYLVPLPSSRFVLFDPVAKNLEYVKGHPPEKFLAIGHALARDDGFAELFLANTDSGSSILPPAVHPDRPPVASDYFFPLQVNDIEVRSLRSCLDQHAIPEVHGIKLDTQGSEFDILRGLDETRLSRLLTVEMEVSLDTTALYHGAAKLPEVIRFMEAAGFRFTNMRICRKPLEASGCVGDAFAATIPAIHECDVFFVRDVCAVEHADFASFETMTRRVVTLLSAHYLHGEAMNLLDVAKRDLPSQASWLDEVRRQVVAVAGWQREVVGRGALSLWHRDKT